MNLHREQLTTRLQRLDACIERLWDQRAYAEHGLRHAWLSGLIRGKLAEANAEVIVRTGELARAGACRGR